MEQPYDAIVVGAGHNGLICAAYLGRSGMRVLVLEARASVGGCASTVDAVGARVNICNCDHLMVRSTPIAEELRLADHGLEYLDVEPAQLALSWTGANPWYLFHDVERTIESLRLTHPDEVAGYRRYLDVARPAAELALELAIEPPKPRRVLRELLARRGRGVSTILSWSRRSAANVLRGFFESEALRAPVCQTGPAVWGLAPDSPGTGLGALGYAMKHTAPTGRPVGGSGALPDAVQAAIAGYGGEIRCGTRVARVLTEAGVTRGVELADGTEIEAPVVVWAGDPSPVRPTANGQEGFESKLDAVISEPPRLRDVDLAHGEALGVAQPWLATTFVTPSLAGMNLAHALRTHHRVAPRPMLFVNVPSVLDPTLRTAEGEHILSLEVIYTPYRLDADEPKRWLELLGGLAEPGFADTVRRWRVMTPADYETEFFLPRGYAGSYAGGPFGGDPELTRYETSTRGLYLTGAATFPGAGIWGASGRNAASVVLDRS